MARKPQPGDHKVLLELRAAELALVDRVCALTGQARVQVIRKGMVDHARRLLAALEHVSGTGVVAGGPPLLQSSLDPELRAGAVAPPRLYDHDHDDDNGGIDP